MGIYILVVKIVGRKLEKNLPFDIIEACNSRFVVL